MQLLSISFKLMLFEMANLQRLIVTLMAIAAFSFVFFGQTVEAAKGPKDYEEGLLRYRAWR